MVPKAQNREALVIEPSGAPIVVASLVCMLATIDLDDQLALDADEVDDVWAQWVLAAELRL